MRCFIALVAIALLSPLALSQDQTPITTEAELIDCLKSTTPDYLECLVTAEIVTLTSGPAIVTKHRRISSDRSGGSTINLASYSLASLYDLDTSGTSRSLSIDGVSITGGTIANTVISATNTVLNITNTRVHDLTLGRFALGRNVRGNWENNRFSNIAVSSLALLVVQDSTWTFINQTFDNVQPGASLGILAFTTIDPALSGVFLTFGGDITFSNILSVPSSAGTGISLLHDSTNTPINISSMADNPSNFIIQNSNISLMTLQSAVDGAAKAIEIGSVYSDSSMIGNPEASQRYLFQIDTSYLASVYPSLDQAVNITVLQDVTSHGMGIVSRAYGRSGVPTDVSKNNLLRIEGALTASITGDQSSLFRLTWPVDIYARSINAMLLPRTGDGLVPSFLVLNDDAFVGSSATLKFETDNDFMISSTNYPWSDVGHPSEPQIGPIPPTPSTSPFSSPITAPSESLSIPYSTVAPINLNAINVAVTIKAGGSFEIRNFSLPRSSSYESNYLGAAITVLRSSLNISTTSGNITFSNNDNVGGRGGAIFVASDAPGLSLNAGGTGSIVFDNNVAKYGGAIFIDPSGDGTASLSFMSSGGLIELTHNIAISGGGAAILPRDMVTALFPASSTLVHGNGAFGYGCIFAFNLSASTSDVDSAVCPSTYSIADDGSNYRLGSGYINASYCPQYESLCHSVPPPALELVSDPTVPLTTPAHTGSPTSSAHSAAGCRNTTRLPAHSVCINGTWHTTAQDFLDYITTNSDPSTGNATSATFDTPIFIHGGNVSVLTVTFISVLLNGPSTAMISSDGCITIGSVFLDLSSEDIEAMEKVKEIATTLIKSSCSPSGTNVIVIGAKPKKNCQSIKIKTQSSRTMLRATMTMSSGKCNVWWIVLVSVMSGVALLVTVAIIVIILLPKEARYKIQPFYKTQRTPITSLPGIYSNVHTSSEDTSTSSSRTSASSAISSSALDARVSTEPSSPEIASGSPLSAH